MKRTKKDVRGKIRLAVALSALITGTTWCGGGSGGYPPAPTPAQEAELAMLDQVSGTASCLPFSTGGQACGSEARAQITSTTPSIEVQLTIEFSDRSSVTCTPTAEGQHCVLQVVVDTLGLPDGSALFTTYLLRDPFSGSYTAEPKPMDPLFEPGQFGGILKLDIEEGSEAEIVLAILIYIPPDSPEARIIRKSQELLEDYHATVVYTTSDLHVLSSEEESTEPE